MSRRNSWNSSAPLPLKSTWLMRMCRSSSFTLLPRYLITSASSRTSTSAFPLSSKRSKTSLNLFTSAMLNPSLDWSFTMKLTNSSKSSTPSFRPPNKSSSLSSSSSCTVASPTVKPKYPTSLLSSQSSIRSLWLESIIWNFCRNTLISCSLCRRAHSKTSLKGMRLCASFAPASLKSCSVICWQWGPKKSSSTSFSLKRGKPFSPFASRAQIPRRTLTSFKLKPSVCL
mmetsp:Transcript_107314/g.256244  ORF Transcript_107314/g.256244 Transcript_107314/m.256244 type:complete len:228 (+) Transcript_107314:1089-1772(+)